MKQDKKISICVFLALLLCRAEVSDFDVYEKAFGVAVDEEIPELRHENTE